MGAGNSIRVPTSSATVTLVGDSQTEVDMAARTLKGDLDILAEVYHNTGRLREGTFLKWSRSEHNLIDDFKDSIIRNSDTMVPEYNTSHAKRIQHSIAVLLAVLVHKARRIQAPGSQTPLYQTDAVNSVYNTLVLGLADMPLFRENSQRPGSPGQLGGRLHAQSVPPPENSQRGSTAGSYASAATRVIGDTPELSQGNR